MKEVRKASVERETKETRIKIELNIDGKGESHINTGIGFFNHMLELFAKQGLFDLKVKARGDLDVDQHHTIEDVGIALGEAFKRALGEKRGIARYGFFVLTMDESLSCVAVDLSGRPCVTFNTSFAREKVGGFETELVEEFFQGFARSCGASVQVRLLCGRNDHHKIESIFKAFGRAMKMACARDERERGVPSTKGVL